MPFDKESEKSKLEIKLSYEGSGVKTLKGISALCYVLGGILLAGGLMAALIISFDDETWWVPLVSGIVSFVFFLVTGTICGVLAGIGRTMAIKRSIIEQEYKIIDAD